MSAFRSACLRALLIFGLGAAADSALVRAQPTGPEWDAAQSLPAYEPQQVVSGKLRLWARAPLAALIKDWQKSFSRFHPAVTYDVRQKRPVRKSKSYPKKLAVLNCLTASCCRSTCELKAVPRPCSMPSPSSHRMKAQLALPGWEPRRTF